MSEDDAAAGAVMDFHACAEDAGSDATQTHRFLGEVVKWSLTIGGDKIDRLAAFQTFGRESVTSSKALFYHGAGEKR